MREERVQVKIRGYVGEYARREAKCVGLYEREVGEQKKLGEWVCMEEWVWEKGQESTYGREKEQVQGMHD